MENALVPSQEEFNTYQVIAKKASESQFFSKIGGESGILSIVLYARELGLPPLQAIFGGMRNIQGNVELSPRLMNSMIRKAGHKLNIKSCTDEVCTIEGIRGDTNEKYETSYSIADAKKAGLIRAGSGWEKFPSDMLFARCLSRIARRLFADIISTSYIEGEISDIPSYHDEQLEKETILTVPVIEKPSEFISSDQLEELLSIMDPEDTEYRSNLLSFYKIDGFDKLPAKKFNGAVKSAKNRAQVMKENKSSKEEEIIL